MWQKVYGRRVHPSRALWNDMRRLQREMDYIFGGTRGPVRVKFPAVNAWVNDEGMFATAEVPGVNPEDIDLSVIGKKLILSGKANSEELPENTKYYRRERGSGEFTRTLELPFHVDADAVEANFNNGILHISLPRLPEEKPKKIAVNLG